MSIEGLLSDRLLAMLANIRLKWKWDQLLAVINYYILQ
jgi:hypothetical protein